MPVNICKIQLINIFYRLPIVCAVIDTIASQEIIKILIALALIEKIGCIIQPPIRHINDNAFAICVQMRRVVCTDKTAVF